MPRLLPRLFVLLLAFAGAAAFAQTAPAPDAALREAFLAEAGEKYGLERSEVEAWLAQSDYKQGIVDAMSRPAEAVKPWKDYRPIFISDRRIREGQAFLAKHRDALQPVAETPAATACSMRSTRSASSTRSAASPSRSSAKRCAAGSSATN